MIRETVNIKAVDINDTEDKIAQFADDTQLINRGDKLSFEKSVQTIEKVGRVSGLYLDSKKDTNNMAWAQD